MNNIISRSIAVALFVLSFMLPVQAAGTAIEVFKSPSCGCCGKWVEHLQKNGFAVTVREVDDLTAQRKALGMPERFASCHSAKVGGYAIEGHVPAADIKRLLKQKPRALGIAVPGMPARSPGMDSPTGAPYESLLVQRDGASSIFARH